MSRPTSAFALLTILVLATAPTVTAGNSVKGYYQYETNRDNLHQTLTGSLGSEQFGAVLAQGDFNDDGLPDLAVSSPTYSSLKVAMRGKVSIFFGREDFGTDTVPAVTYVGTNQDDQLGVALASGDINKDGIADLVMGSLNADKVYIVFGKKEQPLRQEIDVSSKDIDLIFLSPEKGQKFGFSLDVFDANADGYGDVFIGAPAANESNAARAGHVYMVSGRMDFRTGQTYDLAKNAADMIFYGKQKNDQFGATLSHGDYNEDSFPDLAVGAYLARYAGKDQRGTVSVYFGHGGMYRQSPDVLLMGDQDYSWFGYSLSTGDVNNDGIEDLAVTSFPFTKTEVKGNTEVFLGGVTFDRWDKMHFDDTEVFYTLGTSALIHDMNGDGKSEILMGSAGIRSFEHDAPGKVSVLTDFLDAGPNITLSHFVEDLRIGGHSYYDWFGSSMVAGDFNGDGLEDLIVGAPGDFFDKKGRTGAAYFIPGPIMNKGQLLYSIPHADEMVTRASLTDQIVRAFNLKKKNKFLLDQCSQIPEMCLFDFTGYSRFDKVQFTPNLVLYPDVKPEDPYYDSINVATILGLARGFPDEDQSPFHPEQPVTRIHALKMILQAIEVMQWKERVELKQELGGLQGIYDQKTPFADIDPRIPYMWWYPRYVNFAHLTKIIDDKDVFAPDKPLTQRVLEQWIERAKNLVAEK